MLDHGGNLRAARQRYGGEDWIDLSTGINPHGYPAPAPPPDAWHRLPESDPALVRAACDYYGAPQLLPVAGTQAAIQALPRLRAGLAGPARVAVAAPSYAEHAHHWSRPGLIVLRSIGKFFGLAGLRLGFVGATAALLAALDDLLGPWTVSGPAQDVAIAALRDRGWQRATQARLARDGARMRALLAKHGIDAHGTPLFHWWAEPRADAFHEHMARRAIWVRLFPTAPRGIRVGLPAHDTAWARIEQALREWKNT